MQGHYKLKQIKSLAERQTPINFETDNTESMSSCALTFLSDNRQKSLLELADRREDTVSIVLIMENGSNDVCQTEKKQTTTKAKAVYYSLVSQQQKLCEAGQSKGQTSADATVNGS